MERRRFIRNTAVAAGGIALGPAFWSQLFAGEAAASGTGSCLVQRVRRPYGPLQRADANGIRLPEGFTSRVVAITGENVPGTTYLWHRAPDGGACFVVPGGGGDYVYVSNSEVVQAAGGGASAVRFSPCGAVRRAYRILGGTNINCAGGPTPWGTWLSGEEYDGGQVWECDPFRPSQGVARPALGFYAHEAAAVDPVYGHVYLTEDRPDGRLYRFKPAAYPDLSAGRLQVARVVAGGSVVPVATDVLEGTIQWVTVSNGTTGAVMPRPADTTAFRGGEGIWFDHGHIYFTTKGDNRVWRLTTSSRHLCVMYDDDLVEGAPLRGVDNVVVNRAGEVFVAEDGDNMQLHVIREACTVGPLLQIVGQDGSEITGPAFSPGGGRLYFSSQRGADGEFAGITYEVRGPFRRTR